MEVSTVLILLGIGLLSGVMSGFVGVGGGVIIVPALIYLLHLNQHQAQGVSLTLMLPPIGILAVYNYYKSEHLNSTYITYTVVMGLAFILGGYLGSKLSLRLSPLLVKFVFGIIMLYVAIRMILLGSAFFSDRT